MMRSFAGALPVGGDSGTLKHRFASGPARGHVRAKTGSIGNVACLSGYVDRPDGKPPLVFSILLNNIAGDGDAAKVLIDAFVQELAAQAGWPAK
jgi:D-alanyl-D-alanine carboxypeptidase/D-alanyl-D-alanine-endopeptidase (penicillin-binding protein 4)